MCGGTAAAAYKAGRLRGLSPRVRGNPRSHPIPAKMAGSIPACAGEPESMALCNAAGRVYPRVCGGTVTAWADSLPPKGLSPRVRGNHDGQGACDDEDGSIPACAGEPHRTPIGRTTRRVYPRVCGGTGAFQPHQTGQGGLSPRVRGNRRPSRCAAIPTGSIPACAGEPLRRSSATAAARVYPRVCGGTWNPLPRRSSRCGLSPRVRGNPVVIATATARGGSIPACAGEPMAASTLPE